MGKYNSSIYRVKPLMTVIENDRQAFEKLLKLVEIENLSAPFCFYYDGENCKEKRLKPGKDHLLKMIDYMSKKKFEKADVNNEKRRKLYYGNDKERTEAQLEAQNELNSNYNYLTAAGKEWYVFEGFTAPDIFIEGEDYVIVCEGKWTEAHITVETANLRAEEGEYRNQMVRHIQGALNYSNKKVYAFYIVDEECGYLNDLEKTAFEKQLSQETITLSDCEKAEILNSFYGYTTWQEIEMVIPSVHFEKKENIK